jgi:hypothetical protein
MHLDVQLTRNIEIDALRIDGQDGLEIITTDGGKEVRNARTELDPRMWEIALPTATLNGDTDDYDAVRQMWTDTERGAHSFLFYDFIADELVKVRFASPIQISAPAGHLRKIETFTLREVFE